jgi:hypothetical protein
MVTLPSYLEESHRPSATLADSLRRAASFPVMLAFLLVAGCYFAAKQSLLDPDSWWHMAIGQRILTTHSWPWSDTYSATASGAPWIAYEWLGDVIIGGAASFAGLWSATILLIGLAGILVVLLYCHATIRCGNSKAAFVACATLIPILGAFFTLRPQLLGAIFLLVTLIILERFRQGHERALWFLPPLFLIWVNTHGSFTFGFLVLGVAWLSGQFEFSSGGLFAERWTKRQSIQLLLAILACGLVLPITPYGTRVAAYPLSMLMSQPVNVKNIKEWMPVGAETFLGKSFIVIVMGFFLACLAVRPRFRVSEISLALLGVFAACVHIRFLLLFVIFFAPLWATILSRWVPRYEANADHPVINSVLIAIMLCGFVYFFPTRQDIDTRVKTDYPQSAVQYLASHSIRGQVFNDYGWGGYLIWTASPRNMIFIDGRADFYEFGGVLADYLSIARVEPNALHLLDKYGVQACLIRQDAPLGTILSALPSWELAYKDDVAAVYVRKSVEKESSGLSAALMVR